VTGFKIVFVPKCQKLCCGWGNKIHVVFACLLCAVHDLHDANTMEYRHLPVVFEKYSIIIQTSVCISKYSF
jgi:hypothetical protein